MRDLYKGRWASFIGNAGVRALFNLDDYDTAKYWSNFLGGRLVETRSQQDDIYGLTKGENVGRDRCGPCSPPKKSCCNSARTKCSCCRKAAHPFVTDRVPYWNDREPQRACGTIRAARRQSPNERVRRCPAPKPRPAAPPSRRRPPRPTIARRRRPDGRSFRALRPGGAPVCGKAGSDIKRMRAKPETPAPPLRRRVPKHPPRPRAPPSRFEVAALRRGRFHLLKPSDGAAEVRTAQGTIPSNPLEGIARVGRRDGGKQRE